MSAGVKKIIVTDGDSKVNSITTLGEINYLASCMSNSIFHSNEYVIDNLEPTKHKTIVNKQIRLISCSIDFLVDKVTYITSQQGVINLSNRTHTRKRAADNIQLKRSEKINFKMIHNYISPVDNILVSLLNTGISKTNNSYTKKPNVRSVIIRTKGSVTLVPKDGSIFVLR